MIRDIFCPYAWEVKKVSKLYLQIRRLEPNIVAYSALFSPHTGVTDYGLVAQCIANEIQSSG